MYLFSVSVRVWIYIIHICCLCVVLLFFFFKQKTAYEMRISDWSSDVCSSDLGIINVAAEYLDWSADEAAARVEATGQRLAAVLDHGQRCGLAPQDRKSTRLNSSH